MKIKISKMLYKILTKKNRNIPCSKQILEGARAGTIRLGINNQFKIKDICYNHRKNTLCSMLEDCSCYDWTNADLCKFTSTTGTPLCTFKDALYLGAKPQIKILRTLPEMLTIKRQIPYQAFTYNDAPIQRVIQMPDKQFCNEIKFIHNQLHGIAVVCYNDWGEIVGFCIVYPNAMIYANDIADGKAIVQGSSKKYNGLPVTLVDTRLTGKALGTVETLLNNYIANHYKRMISISTYRKLTSWFDYTYENTNKNTTSPILQGQNVLIKLDLSGCVEPNPVHEMSLCSLSNLCFCRVTNTCYLNFYPINSTDAIASRFQQVTADTAICPICGKLWHTHGNAAYNPCDTCAKKLYNNMLIPQCTNQFIKKEESTFNKICYPAVMLDKNGKLTKRASIIKEMLQLM